MLIKTKKTHEVTSSEITSHSQYLDRRKFIQCSAAVTAGAVGGFAGTGAVLASEATIFEELKSSEYSTKEETTPLDYVTNYNNFYEFTTSKRDVARLAKDFVTDPWSVEIAGEVAKPGVYTLEDILKPHALEERIYRLRCVEAWSMVIPWVGFPLADLLKRFGPTSKAKYVSFTTLYDPEQMPGQLRRSLDWPYVEGLRIDEAMNPLTLMAVGLYGEALYPQNGAPIRLVVPWKYGFKSIKSIVKIELTEMQPQTTWNISAPREYGFYANVNPNVDHPRWSQKREQRIPGWFKNHKTALFNGYAEEVASLYSGMDLTKFY